MSNLGKSEKGKKTGDGVHRPPPKKTGKSNLKLGEQLDKDKDFDAPTRTDGTGTPENPPSERPAEETGSLVAKQPPAPSVVGNRMEMHYLKPTFSKTKKGTRLIAFHLSLALTEKHIEDGILPVEVREGWEIMSMPKRRRKRFDIGFAGQRAEFHYTNDLEVDDPKLTLEAAEVTNASLAVIQKKGDGQSQKIIRLSFRLLVPVSTEVEQFAVQNYGNNFWVTLEETQEDLFSEED